MLRALVIGGGIAGTVTGMALRKAGHEVVVYEAYDRSAEGVGAFLTLATNGIDALRALELGELVTGLGIDTPRVSFTNGAGKALGTVTVGELADGTVSQTLWRSDLYVALRDEAVRRGVEIEYGKRLTHAEETAHGVRAEFADGTRACGDLLIGADGLRSTVRTIIDPHAPAATYQGLLNTGGTASGVDVDATPGTMTMVFGRRCFFSYFPHPNGDVWWFANPVRAGEPSAADLRAITDAEFRAELLQLFEADNSPAVDIIRASRGIFPPFATYYFPTVPTWRRGRMIIIGDAAHATSPAAGQGAAQALEDAVTLGRCLRDHDDAGAAFGTYEGMRRDRVEAIVAQGKRNGDGKAPGPVGKLLRDFFMARAFKKMDGGRHDPQRWMWDHHIQWDTPVPGDAVLRAGSGGR